MSSLAPLQWRGGGQVHHNHQFDYSNQISEDSGKNLKNSADMFEAEAHNHAKENDVISSKISAGDFKDENQPLDGNNVALKFDGNSDSFYIGLYSLIFFTSTIVHNLVVEAASGIVTSSSFEGALLGSGATLFQCACCTILPLCLDRDIQMKKVWLFRLHTLSLSELRPSLQLTILVMITTNCANLSVAYVSYPTKVVLKSAKLIPTMVVSTFFHRNKRYSTKDYIVAFCLCVGAAGYSYDPSKNSTDNSTNGQQYYGVILLTISVIMDSFLPNVQQQLMTKPLTIDKSNQEPMAASVLMINVNAIATLCFFLYMFIIEQSLGHVTSFCIKTPKFFFCMVLQGSTHGIAVYAYTKLIKASGSVVAVAISTLRKVVTITLSYIVFPGKPFLKIHCFSVTMVLIGIILQSFWKYSSKPSSIKIKCEDEEETFDRERQ